MTTTEPPARPLTGSKWLSGPYAPVDAEITALDLPVVGTIPEELDGRYLRNGPNVIGAVDPATYHWFTGDGMVHGIRLRDGRAEWYRNRWVRSTKVSQLLGETPAPGERHGGFDNANTNVIGLAGRTYALVEAGARPIELSEELATVCHSDFAGTLAHGFTAHPKVDPATGHLHAVAYHWALPHLEYIVVGADGRVRQTESIEVPDGPMIHDCSITERWMVIYDLPVTFDLDAAMTGAGFPYGWNDAHAARVGLVPLNGRGADVRWFDVEPCYVFHPLNAFDDGDRVVLDVVRYERVFDQARLGPDDTAPAWYRWTLDTATGAVQQQQMSDVRFEFPRVDERVVGRPYRWGYGAETSTDDGSGNDFGGRLVRIDAASGEVTAVDLGPGRSSGEWVMVPREPDAPEDGGWLMALVHDAARDASELMILPAEAPDDGPIARIALPARVPVGFHGNWIPASS
jgi:carotenoid cleavage dioxygenase